MEDRSLLLRVPLRFEERSSVHRKCSIIGGVKATAPSDLPLFLPFLESLSRRSESKASRTRSASTLRPSSIPHRRSVEFLISYSRSIERDSSALDRVGIAIGSRLPTSRIPRARQCTVEQQQCRSLPVHPALHAPVATNRIQYCALVV